MIFHDTCLHEKIQRPEWQYERIHYREEEQDVENETMVREPIFKPVRPDNIRERVCPQ